MPTHLRRLNSMTQEGGGRGTGGLRRLFLLLDLERRDELRPGNFSCLEEELIERDPVRGYRGPAEPREVERFRRLLLARLDREAARRKAGRFSVSKAFASKADPN